MTDKLSDCPFCGMIDSDDNATQESGIVCRQFKSPAGVYAYRVECVCGAAGSAELTFQNATQKWNRRVPELGKES